MAENATRPLLPFTGNLFPNTSYHGRQPRGLCVWHPHGPTETEAWRFFLVDADAPREVKDFLRGYYMRYSGPAGMTEQDDMENWNYATAGSRGVIARRYPFNYQQSLGKVQRDGMRSLLSMPLRQGERFLGFVCVAEGIVSTCPAKIADDDR